MSTHNKRNIYTLIARDVSTDRDDGMNTITKIIEKFTFGIPREDYDTRFHANDQPDAVLFPASYLIASSWYFGMKMKEGVQISIAANIKSPDGASLGGPVHELAIPKGADRVNVNMRVEGLPVKGSGTYQLELKLTRNSELWATGEYPFDVLIEKDESSN